MKIAVCIPHQPQVAAEFAFSLANMMALTSRTTVEFNGELLQPELKLFMRSSPILPQLRNILVQDAIGWGANYLLWADSDLQFPDYALLRLLPLNRLVVGVNYPHRIKPPWPTVTGLDGEPVWTTEALAQALEVQQVRALGFGLCLMDIHIFNSLPRPWFDIHMIGDGDRVIGEDAHFFSLLADAEIPVFVDHFLSWDMGHVHNRVLTHADALADRAEETAGSRVKF